MHNRSKGTMEYNPIRLNRKFPISFPDFTRPPAHPHIHDCFEIGFCFEGGGIFLIEEKMFSCSEGDAVFINNREFHMLRNATPENTRWQFVNFDPVKLLGEHIFPGSMNFDISRLSGRNFRNVIKTEEHPEITSRVRELFEELVNKKNNYEYLVRAMIWEILMKLCRLFPETPDMDISTDSSSIKRIAPSLHYISRNFSGNVRIEDLAAMCNCSLSNFRRIFTKSMGRSPQEYLISFRLNMASLLLRNSSKQIIEISEESGFSTLSNFNRSFKDFFGATPRQYRKKPFQSA